MTKKWEPWNESNAWKSKAEFFTWLRGGLRKTIWQFYPPKNEFKASMLRKATKEDYVNGIHPRTKKVGQCVKCKEWMGGSKLQVDHIINAGSISDEEHIKSFVMNLACSKDDMQLVCVPCHKAMTYADKMGVSYEEAVIEKQAIEYCKKSVTEQKKILDSFGLPYNNADQRRQGFRELITEGKI